MASQELSGACHSKVISCPYKKAVLERAGDFSPSTPGAGSRGKSGR